MEKGEKKNIIKIDAKAKSLGRLASEIAVILMGKHRTSFSRHQSSHDKVEIVNLDKIKFTGNKYHTKKYYRYTGYPSGISVRKLKDLFEENPKEVIKLTVYNMLPKNRLRKKLMKNIIIK